MLDMHSICVNRLDVHSLFAMKFITLSLSRTIVPSFIKVELGAAYHNFLPFLTWFSIITVRLYIYATKLPWFGCLGISIKFIRYIVN